jgi:hypothetical protein
MFPLLERLATTMFLGELINQALFIFQCLGCVTPEDILQLLSFADADILSIRPLNETLQDFSTWVIKLRGKFEF